MNFEPGFNFPNFLFALLLLDDVDDFNDAGAD